MHLSIYIYICIFIYISISLSPLLSFFLPFSHPLSRITPVVDKQRDTINIVLSQPLYAPPTFVSDLEKKFTQNGYSIHITALNDTTACFTFPTFLLLFSFFFSSLSPFSAALTYLDRIGSSSSPYDFFVVDFGALALQISAYRAIQISYG